MPRYRDTLPSPSELAAAGNMRPLILFAAGCIALTLVAGVLAGLPKNHPVIVALRFHLNGFALSVFAVGGIGRVRIGHRRRDLPSRTARTGKVGSTP